MGHAAQTAHPEHGHGAAHAHEEVETPEMKADREASVAVQAAFGRALSRRIAPAMIIAGAGLSLALSSTLSAHAGAVAWTCLLPALLMLVWGLALRRS